MWSVLRARRFEEFKFRRQHPIANYIVDFYCHEQKLVIELDGGYHLEDEQSQYDDERTKNLEHLGMKVLRFWNNEVLNNINGVLETIVSNCR